MLFILKLEVARSYQMLVDFYQTLLCHISHISVIHSHRHENLRSRSCFGGLLIPGASLDIISNQNLKDPSNMTVQLLFRNSLVQLKLINLL
jgi:hypothetical protein